MMNETNRHKDHDLDFLSPEGQQRHDAMLGELTAAQGTIQYKRRTKRRITLTACSAVLLIALTTWAINLNQVNPSIPINHQVAENTPPPTTNQPHETNEPPTLPSASYITRVNAPKSTRWTTTSTADLQSQTVGNPQRIQRITNDDDFLNLLQKAGHNSIGLIRTAGKTTLTGNLENITQPLLKMPTNNSTTTPDIDEPEQTDPAIQSTAPQPPAIPIA